MVNPACTLSTSKSGVRVKKKLVQRQKKYTVDPVLQNDQVENKKSALGNPTPIMYAAQQPQM